MFRTAALSPVQMLLLAVCLTAGAFAPQASAYEPPADPAARIAAARASRAQLIKLRSLAVAHQVDLMSLVQARYGKELPEYLSLSQAAELIVVLQQRGPYDISRPHTLLDRYLGAEEDRLHNLLLWPLVRTFRL